MTASPRTTVHRSATLRRLATRLDLHRSRVRLALSASVAALTAVLGAVFAPGVLFSARFVIAWDAFALPMLVLSWVVIVSSASGDTCHRAAAEDPGRHIGGVLVVAASAVSLFGAIVLLGPIHRVTHDRTVLVAAVLVAVVASWLLTHTVYALRYAHLYYRSESDSGGLEFPGGEKPDDVDFAYFAFTLGMCFQVSDVAVHSRVIRRAVLGHTLLSFAYNTGVLALTLNLAQGLLG